MAGDELGYAAEEEALEASLAVRPEDDKIGLPVGCGIDDGLADVADFDGSGGFESGITQFLCDAVDQGAGRLLLSFELRGVAWIHLGRSGANGLEHVQDHDL